MGGVEKKHAVPGKRLARHPVKPQVDHAGRPAKKTTNAYQY